ncbi:MAG TPA: histidine triad nucleotide-binding protein [Nocardioidaceae bacterium]|jgi:histidine triad (HIT) family protein|nr:histidine triad nucleotide-binding protein [Nocardioidaceae bacterium]
MASDADCVFCKIVAGDIPGDLVHETDTTVAFRDLDPQAPTHVLVVPRTHQPNAAALAAAEPDVLVDLVKAAAAVAEQDGLGDGYRMVFNTGRAAHQTVFHVHLHVLGGRLMGWPPG